MTTKTMLVASLLGAATLTPFQSSAGSSDVIKATWIVAETTIKNQPIGGRLKYFEIVRGTNRFHFGGVYAGGSVVLVPFRKLRYEINTKRHQDANKPNAQYNITMLSTSFLEPINPSATIVGAKIRVDMTGRLGNFSDVQLAVARIATDSVASRFHQCLVDLLSGRADRLTYRDTRKNPAGAGTNEYQVTCRYAASN